MISTEMLDMVVVVLAELCLVASISYFYSPNDTPMTPDPSYKCSSPLKLR
jgi:hypothetical protein